MSLGPNATERDTWEYNRAQNVIDTITAGLASGAYGDGVPLETATRRRAEAMAVQNYLIEKTTEARDVLAAIDADDKAWTDANPAPPSPDEENEVMT